MNDNPYLISVKTPIFYDYIIYIHSGHFLNCVGLNQTVNNETAQRIARNLTEFYKQQFNTSIANVEATVLFSVRRESIAIGIQVQNAARTLLQSTLRAIL